VIEKHRQALIRLGVSAPEVFDDLSDDAVEGVIRWGQDQAKRGHPATSSQICWKLKSGGLEGFGQQAAPSKQWYRLSHARWKWLNDNLPANDPFFAEAAILELARAKQEPSVESVKRLALRLEREQTTYEASLRGTDD
jgi:hypothetical protein